VTFIDIASGRSGRPVAVQSGTGGALTAAFDPAWVLPPPVNSHKSPSPQP